MTNSNTGSAVAAILNKVTSEQRLEVREVGLRRFGESSFPVVQSWNRVMTRTVTQGSPSWQDPVGHCMAFGFHFERNRKRPLESFEQRHNRPQRLLKGSLWGCLGGSVV